MAIRRGEATFIEIAMTSIRRDSALVILISASEYAYFAYTTQKYIIIYTTSHNKCIWKTTYHPLTRGDDVLEREKHYMYSNNILLTRSIQLCLHTAHRFRQMDGEKLYSFRFLTLPLEIVKVYMNKGLE